MFLLWMQEVYHARGNSMSGDRSMHSSNKLTAAS